VIRPLLTLVALLSCIASAYAQQPRISALFPAGAKAGETVDVSVRGAGFVGSKSVLITGAGGVTASLVGNDIKIDESAKPLFQAKCTSCHEPRSPQNRTMNPQQWAETVDRMINARGADINKADRDTLVNYLQAQAKAGEIALKITVAQDAATGMREIRVVTDHGVSTAYTFEVGSFPEVNATEPNSQPNQAQKLSLPVVVNGTLDQPAAQDYFTFEAKKGQRIAFNLKGFRLNEFSQTFFNPVLYLYDSNGKELSKSLGRFGLDPALEWTSPADGTYTLLVRDLLWKGTPASVYRLAIGSIIAEGMLAPAVARPGDQFSAKLIAMGDGSSTGPFPIRAPEGIEGVTTVSTPAGDASLLVRDLPDRGGPNGSGGTAVPLPGVFRGTLTQPGEAQVFRVKAERGRCDLEVYAKRIGSPLQAKVTIKNAKDAILQTRETTDGNDLRIQNAFPEPGEYLVEISDKNGGHGPAYAYYWESLDGAPDFTLTATPDCINIPPGGSIPVLVRATRRENLTGPITLSIPNLPPGVVVSNAVIAPEDDKAILVLSAGERVTLNPHVTPIVGTAPGEKGQKAERHARPLEDIRINGQQRFLQRSSQIVSTTTDPTNVVLRIKGDNRLPLAVGQETKITVQIDRKNNFKGNVVLGILGLPPGVGIERFVNVPGEQGEQELVFRADGNARFLKERPFENLPPMEVVIIAWEQGRDTEPAACTVPLIIVPK